MAASAQRPILQRLFGDNSILGALGVRLDAVPSGRTEWPLLATGVAPAQKVEGVAAGRGGRCDVYHGGFKAQDDVGRLRMDA